MIILLESVEGFPLQTSGLLSYPSSVLSYVVFETTRIWKYRSFMHRSFMLILDIGEIYLSD
jgi:hypothetical protein